MPHLKVKDPAERFDLAYLFANGGKKEIEELGSVAKEFSVYGAVVHTSDLPDLISCLAGTKVQPTVVISFDDGRAATETKVADAKHAAEKGAVCADLVVNLRYVAERNQADFVEGCRKVKQHLSKIKLVCQLPYLWQYDRDAIPWILDLLPEAGVFCIKDWTTRYNFLLPKGEELNVSRENRIAYTVFMADYIAKHNLRLDGEPVIIKIAGGVDASNARSFIEAGADLLGLSYGRAKSVREALLQK